MRMYSCVLVCVCVLKQLKFGSFEEGGRGLGGGGSIPARDNVVSDPFPKWGRLGKAWKQL